MASQRAFVLKQVFQVESRHKRGRVLSVKHFMKISGVFVPNFNHPELRTNRLSYLESVRQEMFISEKLIAVFTTIH